MTHAIRLLIVLTALAPTLQAQEDADFATGNTRFSQKDYLGAYAKWRVAADRGHAGAANNIGHLLRAGLGVQRDYPAALRWFHKAAEGGNATAMHNVGIMYERGEGVQKNKDEALKWYRKADAKGFPGAKQSIARVTAKPTQKPTQKPTRKPTQKSTRKPVSRPKKKPTRRGAPGAILGEIRAVGFNFAPRGWAKCEGQLLPIASNSALFSILGTIYGGDGRTTFALPDLRGRTPVHVGKRERQEVRPGQRWGGARAAPGGTKGAVTMKGLAYTYVIALQGTYPSRTTGATTGHSNGEILLFAGSFSPYNWPACDGQELRIADEQPLYRAIGKTYGGTDSTFRIPDLRGRMTSHTADPTWLGRVGAAPAIARAGGVSQGPLLPRYLGIRHVIVNSGVEPGQAPEGRLMGEIRLFAGTATPKGFAACNGDDLPIARNQALYSLLGTMYGGDGRVKFGLPDLRGRWTMSAGRAPGAPPFRVGQQVGIAARMAETEKDAIRPAAMLRVRTLICTAGIYPSRS